MSNKKNTIKFKGKSPLMKELQKLISFRVYEDIVASGKSDNSKGLYGKAEELYIGNVDDPDSMGYAEQLIAAMPMFDPLFHREVNQQEGKAIFVLKEVFHCIPNARIIVSTNKKDEGINMAVLTSRSLSDRTHLQGRTIFDNAKLVLKNGKKALSIVKRSEFKDGLPSGRTYDDYLLFIRREMYKLLKKVDDDDDDSKADETGGKDSQLDDDDETEEIDEEAENKERNEENQDDDEEDEMPPKWMWPGYLAFALYGPIVPDDMQETLKATTFMATVSKCSDGHQKGRVAARKREADNSNRIREAAPVSEGRGLNNQQQLLAAQIAQQSSWTTVYETTKSNDGNQMYLQLRVTNLEKTIDRWIHFCKPEFFENPELHEDNYAFQKVREAEQELEVANQLLKEHMEKANSSHASKNQYQAFVDLTLERQMPPQDAPIGPGAPKKIRADRPSTPVSAITTTTDHKQQATLE